MIRWVYERASRVRGLARLLVATDDERIASAVRAFGGEAVMTPRECPSGSDRVWEAVKGETCDVILNLQGDEPTLDPAAIETLIGVMAGGAEVDLGTLVTPLQEEADYRNPNVVKVVLGTGGRCLYFSRSPIPNLRGQPFGRTPLWRHVGVYAYRRDFLKAFVGWPPGEPELSECLEQLRALERGAAVFAAPVEWPGCAVDEPGDIAAVEKMLSGGGGSPRPPVPSGL
jgi:3-deoxy-manno-octulosonate cytidylyltransferase (CMP-KDO synthetase)